MKHNDPDIPWLEASLDPAVATRTVGRRLTIGEEDGLQVRSTTLLKWRPGRRAVVAYDLQRTAGGERFRVVGKIRSRGLDRRTFRLHQELVVQGFGEESEDGISVPHPLAVVPRWKMWLQRFVPGRTLDRIVPSLPTAAGRRLMRRVVRGLNKLHRSRVPSHRSHRAEDELRILGERLEPARGARPDLAPAIDRIEEGCRRLAARLPRRPVTGIHRDFHPAQIILHGDRIQLLDLDLYAWGDPALDVGNFTAHLTEGAIRAGGTPQASAGREEAVMEEALECDPIYSEGALRHWHTLSLARHVGLSVTRPGRAHTTALLVEEVSRQLSKAGVLPPLRSANGRPRATSKLALALVILGAAFTAGVQPAAGQTQHSFQAGLDVSSLYDSNINRDRENLEGLAGVVTTGILRYRMRAFLDLRAEYEVGLHRYAEPTSWDRVSHKVRLDGRRPLGAQGTLGLVTELAIRGSDEDRSLGNQLSLEPSIRVEPWSGTELRLRGVARIRRNEAPSEDETNLFLSLELERELASRTELEVELRYEWNRSESGRRNFHGPRTGLGVTHALTPRDELLVELEYRERRYEDRWVDASPEDTLRRDVRLTPRFRWRRSFGDLVRATLEYEYERRDSNDPDRIMGGHLVILGARILL